MLLGELLVRRGAVSTSQVDEALKKKEGKERIGQALVRLGFAGEEDVLQALSEQTRVPTIDLATAEIDTSLLNPQTVKTVFQRKVLPIDRTNGTLRVAVSDPLDLEVLDDLRLLLKAKIQPFLARPSEIDRLIKKHYGVAADEVGRMVDQARSEIEIIREAGGGEDDTALAEDAALDEVIVHVTAGMPQGYPAMFDDVMLRSGEFSMRGDLLLVFGVSVLAMIGLLLLLYRTRLGLATRA
ncbi:MAG TPA: hypothetical protein VJB14_01180, partial [Planctomycetota bacterium]|nr:hypothetical protein [Planctomycetota bacterium]